VEPCPGSELVVSLFEVAYTAASVAAFIGREHEFRLVAVAPHDMEGRPLQRLAVRAGGGEFKATRTVCIRNLSGCVWVSSASFARAAACCDASVPGGQDCKQRHGHNLASTCPCLLLCSGMSARAIQ
jgi:hypothetical protein